MPSRYANWLSHSLAARLRDAGTAVLLVEQLIEKALALSDRVYALARCSIVLEDERGGLAEPAGADLLRQGHAGASLS